MILNPTHMTLIQDHSISDQFTDAITRYPIGSKSSVGLYQIDEEKLDIDPWFKYYLKKSQAHADFLSVSKIKNVNDRECLDLKLISTTSWERDKFTVYHRTILTTPWYRAMNQTGPKQLEIVEVHFGDSAILSRILHKPNLWVKKNIGSYDLETVEFGDGEVSTELSFLEKNTLSYTEKNILTGEVLRTRINIDNTVVTRSRHYTGPEKEKTSLIEKAKTTKSEKAIDHVLITDVFRILDFDCKDVTHVSSFETKLSYQGKNNYPGKVVEFLYKYLVK